MSLRSDLINRAMDTILYNEAYADQAVRELLLLYDEAAYQVEQDISALVGRFAEKSGLSQEVARQMLESDEINHWRMSLEQYIAQLPEAARGSKLELELNLLSAKSQINREEQLLGEIYKNIANMAGLADEQLAGALSEVYRINYRMGMFNIQNSIGLGFNIARINEKAVLELLRYPWQTKTFSANIWGKADTIAGLLRRELAMGFIQGSSVQEMARAVNDVMDAGRYNAERLVRTECKYFANQGELAGYKANGIEKYRFVGGSEGSGSCDCTALNGKEFLISEAEAGVNFPPLHPNCLCIVIAVFSRGLFDDYSDVQPLRINVNFEKWAAQYAV